MGRGDLILLRPGQDHELMEASEDLDLLVMAASPELVDRLRLGPLPTALTKVTLNEPDIGPFSERLLGLQTISDGVPHEDTIGRLFSWTLENHPRGHSIARRSLHELYQDTSVSGACLAERLRVPQSEVSRMFARDLGLRLVDARARLRLMDFINSVDLGDSLTRAAAIHFGSYAQCHRVFRRHLGCSPQEFFAGQRTQIADARSCARQRCVSGSK